MVQEFSSMYSLTSCPCNLNQLSFIYTFVCNIFVQTVVPELASNHHRDGKRLKK